MDRRFPVHDPIGWAHNALDKLAGAPAPSGIDLSGARSSAHVIYLAVMEYNIPCCCAAAHYPEANVPVPLADHDRKSGTPTCRFLPVCVRRGGRGRRIGESGSMGSYRNVGPAVPDDHPPGRWPQDPDRN